MMILAQCAISSSASYQNDNYRTNVLDHRTGVGGDVGGGHHGADGDEDQEDLEEDHLGAG